MSKKVARKVNSEHGGAQAPTRAIDMVPKTPMRHTLRIQKAEGGGYSLTHETSHGGNYSEKVHIAPDRAALQKIVGKIL